MSPNSVKAVSVFKPIENSGLESRLAFTFDGRSLTAAPGMTVAAALLAEGIVTLRDTPVSGSPRGPFCLMGACYDCLVQVDGITVQACMTPVREGLVVARVPIDDEND